MQNKFNMVHYLCSSVYITGMPLINETFWMVLLFWSFFFVIPINEMFSVQTSGFALFAILTNPIAGLF